MPAILTIIIKRLQKASNSLAILVALLCILSGIIGLLFLQGPISDTSFDIRQQASTQDELPSIHSPQANSVIDLERDERGTISLETSTDVERVELFFHVATQFLTDPEINLTNTLFTVSELEIESVNDGYLIKLIAQRSSTTDEPAPSTALLNLSFATRSSEEVFISFDTQKSVFVVNGNKQIIGNSNFRVQVNLAGTEIRPTPTPSPTPSSGSCNQVCTSHSQCPVNHLCYNANEGKRCRLVTNPTSTSCNAQAATSEAKQCNEYCANTGECKAGLTCWYNRCRQPDNLEDTSCAALPRETKAAITSTCNAFCRSNRECPINMRCYNSQCRLATNPSSTSCSISAAPTVSSEYLDSKGGSETSDASSSATSSGIVVASPILPQLPLDSTITTDASKTATTAANTNVVTRYLIFGLLTLGLIILAILAFLTLRRKLHNNRRPPTPPTPAPAVPKPIVSTNRPLEARPISNVASAPVQNSDLPQPMATSPHQLHNSSTYTPKPIASSPPQSLSPSNDLRTPTSEPLQSRQIPIPPAYPQRPRPVFDQPIYQARPQSPVVRTSPVVSKVSQSSANIQGTHSEMNTLSPNNGNSMINRLKQKNITFPK